MYTFYLQYLPTHKYFDPWDVECLLSLLGSWAAASFLLTLNMYGKLLLFWYLVWIYILIQLVYELMNTIFLKHTAMFIPLSGDKTHWLGHLPPQIHYESHSSVNHHPILHLKINLWCIEPFRKKSDGSWVHSYSLLTVDSICPWVQGWFSLSQKGIRYCWGMSPGAINCVAALKASVSLVSILHIF